MKDREPERNESTDESVWLDLVSRLQNMPADETHGGRDAPQDSRTGIDDAPHDGPGTEGGDDADGISRGPFPRSAAERTRAIFENQPFRTAPPRGPRDYDEPEELESEGEFVPPEPPPLSTGEPLVVLAWIGAVGGPIMLLLFAMFWRSAPLAVILGVIALFIAAAGYLLFRLPQHRSDDGAAV
ncbi:hypothetical protein MUG94_06385 [Arthrobacter gengyunqii]|uniref:DUF308 domain-containing protein n=1 Tax=Arthrobacter gengyunqii TaxID=2886940 RepID=A0A9X1M453_9MICC|nr:hypothetical protein [Arthrobacter gengyunqii]MCC3270587.1 hypothetical protein [Arthrobacter gengyunqii]UOY97369.1 hypothetical protein MUG94_06385 [Arthrobacter gengyunqii]